MSISWQYRCRIGGKQALVTLVKYPALTIKQAQELVPKLQISAFEKSARQCFTKRLNRAKLHHTLSQLPSCNIAMESCSTSHYWGRACQALEHIVQLIPAQHVTLLFAAIRMKKMIVWPFLKPVVGLIYVLYPSKHAISSLF